MRNLFIFAISIGIVGCASGPKSDKGAVKKYTQMVKAKGLNKVSRKVAAQCPNSKRSWKGATWKRHMELANACVKAKKWNKLDEIANHMAQSEHLSPWGSYYLSVSALSQKNYERAQWMVDLAIKKAPREGILHYQKGRIHWALNEYEQGIAAFKMALRKNKNLVDAHYFLGQVYFRDQNFKKAVNHFEKVLNTNSSHPVALMGMAESQSQLGRSEEAVEYFERAINQSPRHLGLRLKLAHVYENQQKDYEAALKTYKRIRDLNRQKRLRGKLIMNIDDKIKTLEAALGKNTPGKKVTRRSPAKK